MQVVSSKWWWQKRLLRLQFVNDRNMTSSLDHEQTCSDDNMSNSQSILVSIHARLAILYLTITTFYPNSSKTISFASITPYWLQTLTYITRRMWNRNKIGNIKLLTKRSSVFCKPPKFQYNSKHQRGFAKTLIANVGEKINRMRYTSLPLASRRQSLNSISAARVKSQPSHPLRSSSHSNSNNQRPWTMLQNMRCFANNSMELTANNPPFL